MELSHSVTQALLHPRKAASKREREPLRELFLSPTQTSRKPYSTPCVAPANEKKWGGRRSLQEPGVHEHSTKRGPATPAAKLGPSVHCTCEGVARHPVSVWKNKIPSACATQQRQSGTPASSLPFWPSLHLLQRQAEWNAAAASVHAGPATLCTDWMPHPIHTRKWGETPIIERWLSTACQDEHPDLAPSPTARRAHLSTLLLCCPVPWGVSGPRFSLSLRGTYPTVAHGTGATPTTLRLLSRFSSSIPSWPPQQAVGIQGQVHRNIQLQTSRASDTDNEEA